MHARAAALLAVLILTPAAALFLTSAVALSAGAHAETLPLPGDAATGASQDSQIWQVSCPAAGDCVGVGAYHDASSTIPAVPTDQALIESEANGVWSPSEIPDTSLPDYASPPLPYLNTVACTSVDNCVAADAYDDANAYEQGLIDTEAAGVWTPMEAPLTNLSVYSGPSGPGAEVYLMACPVADACVGAGTYVAGDASEHGLIETQSQSGWTASEAPAPPDSTVSSAPDFYDLSCAAARNCAAVGYYTDSSGNQQGLLESDRDGSWTAHAVDLSILVTAADPQVWIYAVSCAAAGSCTAVGAYESGAGSYEPLAVSEVDGSWQPAVALSLPGDASTTADVSGDPIQN
ncbi:MAG: hypothetical protein ACRDNS_01630, partial [Trebonia sp.]